MTTPPRSLDGAVVLYHVELPAQHQHSVIGCSADGTEIDRAPYLAICRYPGEEQVFLFTCAENWEVLADSVFGSVEAALKDAAASFKGLHRSAWTKADGIEEEERTLQANQAAEMAGLPADYASEETLRRLANGGQELDAMARLRKVKGLSLFEAMQKVKALKEPL